MKITSKTDPTKTYEVDIAKKTCECIGFKFRQHCKHLTEALQTLNTNDDEEIQFIETNDNVIDFIEKYGEQKLINLLAKGIVIEQKGKLIKI